MGLHISFHPTSRIDIYIYIYILTVSLVAPDDDDDEHHAVFVLDMSGIPMTTPSLLI